MKRTHALANTEPTGARRERERGAAAVEFAILLPVLILLLFGIAQFAIAYNHAQAVHAAAREGARIASLPASTQSDITSRVTSALNGTGVTSPNVSISPNTNQPCLNNTGNPVTVTVTASQSINIPLWNNVTKTLTGKGTFQCE
jgi:Flp pilus assembly protein TadG